MNKQIYHIALDSDWQSAQAIGAYRTDSLAYEGFIHCATKEQLPGVFERYFQEKSPLWLLGFDPEDQPAELIFENLNGGEDKFPHLYGELMLTGVQTRVLVNADGILSWPPEWA